MIRTARILGTGTFGAGFAAFFLAFCLMLPAAQAAEFNPAQDVPTLVDASFAQAEASLVSADFVSAMPVVDQPATPVGADESDRMLVIVGAVVAATVGFAAGMIFGCFGCFFLYYMSFFW